MALGKYSRIDNRPKTTNYCSTFTILAFVALCLVGIWMMTSSAVVPAQNPTEKDAEVKLPVIENGASESKSFDDNQGNLPEDATKGDATDPSARDSNNQEVKPDVKPEEKKPDIEKKSDETGNSGNGSKSDNFSDADDSPKTDSGSISDDGSKLDSGSNSDDAPKAEDRLNSDDVSKSDKGPNSNDKGSNSDDVSKSENGSNPDDNGSNPDDVSTLEDSNKEDDNSASRDGDRAPETGNQKSDGSGDDGMNTDSEAKDKTSFDGLQKDSASSGKDNGTETAIATANNDESLPSSAQAELSNETTTQTGSWSTQAVESKDEKESQSTSSEKIDNNWKLCNTSAGPDFIPCLDNVRGVKALPSTKHYEHRERHCPLEPPTCLVPLPEGYKTPIQWSESRDKIWYKNVPHTQLAAYKGHQNWVKVTGDYLTFPGGGTQFTHGALHYIDFINESIRDLKWGKRTRVILDVGCGVASFGGYLFERDVLTMSFAPKDEHEAQVQFALERGIPAFSAVMGTMRLPFPAMVFDAVHCARCRVPWHIEGGKLLLELNRVLRPGGFFIWSATPVYQRGAEDQAIWRAMQDLTKKMCWELVTINKDKVNGVGIATFRKPQSNDCYTKRSSQQPPLCPDSDNRNAAWRVPLQSCMHKIPVGQLERGSRWPEQWPARLVKAPYWMASTQVGVYGKPEPEDFSADYDHWQRVVSKSYLNGLGIDWKSVRNVMDMRAVYGGFAAAMKDLKVWVMNVVPVDSPDTLPIIYERGLFGMYHDWCESFSTYPRTYDLLHADTLFSNIKKRCSLAPLLFEVDRILRPGGKLIVRDRSDTVEEVEGLLKSLNWETRMIYSKGQEGLLLIQKTTWRPSQYETLPYAF